MPTSVQSAPDGTPLLYREPYLDDPESTPPMLLAFDDAGMAQPMPLPAPPPEPAIGAAPVGAPPPDAPPGALTAAPLAPAAPAPELPPIGLDSPLGDAQLRPPTMAPPVISAEPEAPQTTRVAAAGARSGVNLGAAKGIAGEIESRAAQLTAPEAERAADVRDAGLRAVDASEQQQQREAAVQHKHAVRNFQAADRRVETAQQMMDEREQVHQRNMVAYTEKMSQYEQRIEELNAEKPWILGKGLGSSIMRGFMGALAGGLGVANPHMLQQHNQWLDGMIQREARRQAAITEIREKVMDEKQGVQIREDAFKRDSLWLHDRFIEANVIKRADAQLAAEISMLAPGRIRAAAEQGRALLQQKYADKMAEITDRSRRQATEEVKLTREQQRWYASHELDKRQLKLKEEELELQRGAAKAKAGQEAEANLVRDTIGRPLAVFGPGRSEKVKDEVNTMIAGTTDLAEAAREYRALQKMQGQPWFNGTNTISRVLQSQHSARMQALQERMVGAYRKATAGLTATGIEMKNVERFLPTMGKLYGGDAEVFLSSIDGLIEKAAGEATVRGGFDPASSKSVRTHLQQLAALPDATATPPRELIGRAIKESASLGSAAQNLLDAASNNPTIMHTPEMQSALKELRQRKTELGGRGSEALKMLEELAVPERVSIPSNLTPAEQTGAAPAILDLGLGGN